LKGNWRPGFLTKLLLLHEANPVYGSPTAWRVREALSKIPFIASFGSFIDETSILADLILPDHSFLESWGTYSGVRSEGLRGKRGSPAMRPIHDDAIDAGCAVGCQSSLWQKAAGTTAPVENV
jgi:anaerobic selenocysteine-containing dehydrogenase